ncbi:MAG TPA: ATP-binding cassette domain-containing protein, partial [Gaiellaceae bacterium]
MALLELDGLHARYGAVPALHGLSLTVGEGSFVALLGANGAGKTTTLRAISGLVRKTGEVVFGGQRISR